MTKGKPRHKPRQTYDATEGLDEMTAEQMRDEIVALRTANHAGLDVEAYKAIIALGEALHAPLSSEQRERAIEAFYVVMDMVEKV